MFTHILPTEERLCNFNEIASPMDHCCEVDTLPVSLQSCATFSVTGSDSPNNLVVSNIPITDNLVGAFKSIVTIESNGQRDHVEIDNVRLDDASETVAPEIAQSSILRSPCKSKSKQKSENQKATRKSRRMADKRVELDKVFLKVARGGRSGLCKQARSSSWGSLEYITEVFKQNTGNDINQNEHKESVKARTGRKGGKRNKNRKSQSSQAFKSEAPAITRCTRLKAKLHKEASPSCPSDMLPSIDKDIDNLGGGVMMKSLELDIENMNKDVVHLEDSILDVRLPDKVIKEYSGEKFAEDLHGIPSQDGVQGLEEATEYRCLDPGTSPESEVSIIDVQLPDKVIKEYSGGKAAEDHGISSQDGVQGLEEATEYRCLDPGTSPESEVINVNPDAQISGIVSEELDDVLISSKGVGLGDLTTLSPSETSSEKGSSKDTLYQAGNSAGECTLSGKEIINDCVLYNQNSQKEILGDIPYNGISISTNTGVASSYASSSEGYHIEPLYSSPVTKDGGPAETLKFESGGEFVLSHGAGLESPESQLSEKSLPHAGPMARKLPKSSKSKGMTQSVNTKRSDCKQKGCESKSSGGYEIKEKDVDEAVCKVQSFPETGIDEVNDVKYRCRSTIEGSSNLNVLPSGFVDQHELPRNAWVCCDDCYKWRRIPAVLADSIEDANGRWICKDNMDKAFADCSIPQEKSNADIDAELEISDGEDNPNTRLNFNQIVQKQPTVPVQAPWKPIKSNLFLHRNRKNQTIDEVMVCQCKPPLDGRKGCRDGCLNRMLNIECAKGTCPCGELCSNQQFQKRKYAKLKCFRCGKKGFGLQAQEDIPKGRFLIEYVGEVLDMHAHEARQREYASKGHKHFYFMTLNGSEVIDACAKGNLGRFINHSCEPNCQTEKWMVNGEVCIGLFAARDIMKGEEVTFDYNYVRVLGAAARKCVCGSSLCRGYIGGDPQNAEVIVDGDSDDEYLEPVMLNEDGADKLDNLMPGTSFFKGIQIISPESLLKNNVEADKCFTALGHLEITEEKKSPETLFEGKADYSNSRTAVCRLEITSRNEDLMSSSDTLKSEPSFELEGRLELLPSDQTAANLSQRVQHVAVPLQSNEGKSQITSEDTNMYSREEDEKLSLCTIEQIETSSLSSTMSNLSPSSSKVKKQSKSNKVKTARLTSKSHPLTKLSCPSSLVEGGKFNNKPVNLTKPPQMENHSLAIPGKPKKLLHAPLDGRFEAVQQTLNELLDADGGISKWKDASRGYLKLLYQTVASGDSGNGEGIQSNRDLSMILDALLKTKSRTVLADILNKNGLQMLHNILKRYRKEFNKIPILRKLLKVLEYLAVRKILTMEIINQGSPRPGVVSLKESILELTEHIDKQVHQIARSFRDKWIQRRRHNYKERDVDRMDLQRDFRSSASRDSSSDRDRRPMEAIDNCAKQSSSTSTLDGGTVEGSSASCTNTYIPTGNKTHKRKSRWDQPENKTSPSNKEPSCLPPRSHPGEKREADYVNSEEKRICRRLETDYVHNESQNTDEDAPPGFSFPLKDNLVQSYVSDFAADVAMGQPQERFISSMPVSYGVPLPILQQLETPQAVAAESWAIAPAMPFQSFPPLPLHPCDKGGPQPPSCSSTVNLPAQEQAFRNQNTPTTSGSGPQDMVISFPKKQSSFQGGGGHSHNMGRKYFRQQKWNNPRNGPPPPWMKRNNGWGGFKGPANSSNGMSSIGIVNGVNGPHGHYNSGAVSNGSLSSGTGFPRQSQHYN